MKVYFNVLLCVGNVQNVACPFPIPQNCTVDEFKAAVIRYIAHESGGNEHLDIAVLGTFEQFIQAVRVRIVIFVY
jgi:hypothetical protein